MFSFALLINNSYNLLIDFRKKLFQFNSILPLFKKTPFMLFELGTCLYQYSSKFKALPKAIKV
jgi:hypothetical protein